MEDSTSVQLSDEDVDGNSNASIKSQDIKNYNKLMPNDYPKSLIPSTTQINDQFSNADLWRPWLLKFAFVIDVGLALGVCCLALRFQNFKQNMLVLGQGDQRLMPISTYFCKNVRLHGGNRTDEHSKKKKLKLTLLKGIPVISNTIKSYKTAGRFRMPSWTHQFWGYHLLKGTVVKISVCSDMQVQFYILKGSRKLKLWTEKILFDENDYHKLIQPSPSGCASSYNFKHHVLSVHETDTYYFLFTNSIGWRFVTTIHLALTFNRTYYEVEQSRFSCITINHDCVANLTFASKDVAMVEVISSNDTELINPFEIVKISYEFGARWKFYGKLFGGLFGCVVTLTVLYTIWRLIVSCKDDDFEHEPLLDNDLYYSNKLKISKEHANLSKSWLVISPVPSANPSEALFEVKTTGTVSLDRSGRHARSRAESQSSRFMRRRNESDLNAYEREQQRNYDMEQFMESIMTQAGVSAI